MQIAVGQIKNVVIISKWVAIIGGLLLGLLVVPFAFAHAELSEASPAIGSVYRWNRPTEVRLTFTQQLQETGNSIIVTNRQFKEMHEGSTQLDPDDPYTIFVRLGPLSNGTYTVNWETKSVDGHSLQGSYEFTLFSREAIITRIVAAIVLLAFGTVVYRRRARPEDLE